MRFLRIPLITGLIEYIMIYYNYNDIFPLMISPSHENLWSASGLRSWSQTLTLAQRYAKVEPTEMTSSMENWSFI